MLEGWGRGQCRYCITVEFVTQKVFVSIYERLVAVVSDPHASRYTYRLYFQ